MDLKLACVLAFFLCYLTPASAKPTTNLGVSKNEDLAEKFVEFLEQDKQFKLLLSQFEENDVMRQKRQTMINMEDDEDVLMDNPPSQKEGFMDRAAKFVMELLQRFLRWINTE